MIRYDYGSPGVLGYYQATLQDIVQYPDARTDLFHNFREFGNAVLFCLMLEQSLIQEEVMDLLHAAPFQNILPRPFCKVKQRFDGLLFVVYSLISGGREAGDEAEAVGSQVRGAPDRAEHRQDGQRQAGPDRQGGRPPHQGEALLRSVHLRGNQSRYYSSNYMLLMCLIRLF